MSHYEPGKEYFLKATVRDIYGSGQHRLRVTVPVSLPKQGECTEIYMANEPGLLLAADEVAGTLKTKADAMEVVSDSLNAENKKLRDKVNCTEAELAELKKANDKLAERISTLQRDLLTAETNYNSCSDELAECKKKLKEAEAKIRTLTKKNRCLRKEADRGDVIAKALADTILDICDNGDLILEEE